MEGEGEFKHQTGHTLKGLFRKNLFSHGSHFLNPLEASDVHKAFEGRSEVFQKKCAAQKKEHEERVRIFKVQSQQELEAALQESKVDGRVCLMQTSLE